MLLHIKTAFRHLRQHRLFTVLNMLGLSTGLASTILILLWVCHELSYDNFHSNGPHLYRVTVTAPDGSYPLAGAPLAEDIRAQIPGIKNVARVKANYGWPVVFSVGNKHFETNKALYADPEFLRMFSFPLVSGDAMTALVQPNGLLLTQETAKRFFGTSDNVVGKTIRMSDTVVFTVTGVLRDIPANSHLQFSILLPMSYDARADGAIRDRHYDELDFYTYVQLDEHADASPAALAAMGRTISEINHRGEPSFNARFELQPLSRIHLYSTSLLYDIGVQGNIAYVRIFSVIAVFILLVACINFMNLATARSVRRAREVGVRKAIGATRGQLIGQFLGESLLLTFLALLLGLALAALALPAFNQLLGTTLVLPLARAWFIGGLIGVLLVTALVAGFYPAFFLSSFRPIRVLRTMIGKTGGGGRFRNGLVVFQFVIAVVLIIGTAVVYRQLRYIRDRDLGYDKENLLYIPLKGDLGKRLDALTAALRDDPRLSHFSVVSEVPVNVTMGTAGVDWPGKAPDTHPMFAVIGVDEHFLDLFKMKLVVGRDFSPAFPTDTLNYIVNEKALRLMGLDVATAIGRPLQVWDGKGMIIGVVKDFNFKPVQSAIDPLVLRYNPGRGKEWLRRQVVIRTPVAGVPPAIADLQTIWSKLNPAYSFEYQFVDRQLALAYQAEERLSTLFNTFALLAIFISCLGLTGLAAFTAEQRTKEIGIRKVLGADVMGIVALLSSGFVRLVLIATVIASPIAWYFMHRWLEDFAYRIPLSGWFFVFAGVLALMIALVTVSWQALRASMVNPVESLRSE